MASRRFSTKALKDRLRLMFTAENDFVDSVKSTEKSLWSKILGLLRGFTVKDGNIQKDGSSTRVAGQIRKEVRSVIKNSTIGKKVDDFLPKFDEVDVITKRIYEGVVGTEVIIPDASVEKNLAIDQVISSLKELRGLEAQYEIPLRRLIFQAVNTNMKFTDAQESIRAFIIGTTKGGGELGKFSRQVTADLLNGYAGLLDFQIAQANGLDGFFFTGSLIDTSRQTCIDMVNGTGEFEDLAIEPGLYAIADIPEIVKRGKDNPGWRPETTPSNYPILRNGYNCRHPLLFVSLLESEKAKRREMMRAVKAIKKFRPR